MNLTQDNSGFIRKLFLRHVWPSVAAQVLSTIGPIVGGVIAGRMFGQIGLAVNGLFSPFFFLAGFLGTIIASGSATLAAGYIAKDDHNRVAEIYTLSLLLSAGLSAIICLALVVLREPVLAMVAGAELLEPALRYYFPTIWYMFFTAVVYMPLAWSRLVGKPAIALILTLTMTGSNIALSGLFVFVLRKGLESLAVSQALSTALAAAIALFLLHMRGNGLRFQKPRHIFRDALALTSAGSPLGLSRLYRFTSVFLLNVILLNVSGAGGVAVFSVLNMLLRFVTAVANGISGVQMPIARVLLEEWDATSLRQLARSMFRYGNLTVVAAAVLLLLFRNPLASVFGMVGEVFFAALLCFCLYIPFYMNGSLLISWYTAVRQTAAANIIAFAQDLAFLPLFAALFSHFGAEQIWLHLPVAGASMVLLLPIVLAFVRRSNVGLTVPLLIAPYPGGTVLAFSVERNGEKASRASEAVGEFCEGNDMDKRQSMLLSMAIEELVTLIANYDKSGGEISVRLTRFDGGIILRLRDSGRKFNPIDYYSKRMNATEDIEKHVDLMGVMYVVEAAKAVYYRETFGVNSLVIIL